MQVIEQPPSPEVSTAKPISWENFQRKYLSREDGFPLLQQVDVYSGKNLDQMNVCYGEKLCSAAPVLPDFELPVEAIFRK